MNTSYVITVPIRLYSEANNTEHWSVKYSRHKKHNLIISSEWRKLPPIGLPVTIKLTRVGKRTLDHDNLIGGCFKHIRDIVSDLLLKEDRFYFRKTKSNKKKQPVMKKVRVSGKHDSDDRITWEYHQCTGKTYGLIIEIIPRNT